jgi:CheY-like chemotaxis protein
VLVDDRRDIRYVGQHFLDEAGAEVTTTENGKEALRLVQEAVQAEAPFDVIVMDRQMPVMDGHTAASELRAMGSNIPIIASHLRKRFRTACKVLGAERIDRPTIQHGRHTFISHSLAGGRTLAEARDAAGHANVSITSGYLLVAVADEEVGKLVG